MDVNQTAEQVIASALQLPPDQRAAIVDALTVSLPLEQVDHGPEEPAAEVASAWSDEIARRIKDIKSGRVSTIPAEEAEKAIRGDE